MRMSEGSASALVVCLSKSRIEYLQKAKLCCPGTDGGVGSCCSSKRSGAC